MNRQDFLNALIAARGQPQEVAKLPGAFVHRLVDKHTSKLRALLPKIPCLPIQDQASFIKSLALYEQTVGGIGSPTLLFHALPAVSDPEHELFNWVLTHTTSYDYYARGAKSFAELQQLEAASRARKAANLERERQRGIEASKRRAERASANLFNAIRRGDSKAVEALLRQGARPDASNSDGLAAADYAEKVDRPVIAQLIRDWQNAH